MLWALLTGLDHGLDLGASLVLVAGGDVHLRQAKPKGMVLRLQLDGPALEASVVMAPPQAAPAPAPRVVAAPVAAPEPPPWRWWVTPLVGACALVLGALAVRTAGGQGEAEESVPTIGG